LTFLKEYPYISGKLNYWKTINAVIFAISNGSITKNMINAVFSLF